KTAVLNTLTSASGQRTYDHAIREFVAWYCSEPGSHSTGPSCFDTGFTSSNADTRRRRSTFALLPFGVIADEAADAGLVSAELVAGIRRVKGVRRIGVRLGNWLTPEQGPPASRRRPTVDGARVA